jgi:hypothetical protein
MLVGRMSTQDWFYSQMFKNKPHRQTKLAAKITILPILQPAEPQVERA